jgi:glycosyltransferase involved in cell wall biosynthesis
VITLDLSAAVHHRAGLGRYAASLARALKPLIHNELALFYNAEQGVEPLPDLENLPTSTVALGYKPWRMSVWLGQLARAPFNRLVPEATLFHATEHLLMPLRGVPTVLTVHDLIFHHLPQHHKPLNRWYLGWTMPLYCRRADHIIAVSEATRRDLIEIYGVSPEKVTVVLEAADPRFQPPPAAAVTAARARYKLPDDYVLYLGTIEPRKNLIRMLHAWSDLYQAGEAPPWVIVGQHGWLSDDFYAALKASPSRGAVRFTGYVEDADLPALYAGATTFVFPSLYEGFGLPPLEAMACGAPVLCANTSSLPEVVGDAALTVDPTDTDALRTSLRRMLRNADLRAELRTRGLERAAQFSWKRAARETLAVYRSLQP